MSTLTVQRVRELQEQIKAAEKQLQELSKSEEYQAEQAFIQDLHNVLETHGRTMREAVMAIDPSLLAQSASKAKPAAKAATSKPAKRPYTKKADKPAPAAAAPSVSHSTRLAEPPPAAVPAEPAPTLSPASVIALQALASATNKQAPAKGVTIDGKPRVRAPNTGKGTDPAKAAWNAKRSAENRLKNIREGRWFVFTNPHTGEKAEGSKVNTETLRTWAAEYGRGVVEKWGRPLTKDEIENGVQA